jgi:hypothetical protein
LLYNEEVAVPAKAIRINKYGQVVAVDAAVGVSKKDHEDVLWIDIQNGGPWTITFDKPESSPPDPSKYPVKPGSPFSEDYYWIAKGASSGSTGGPVRGNVGNTYRYRVRKGGPAGPDPNGPITHDPDVDVES